MPFFQLSLISFIVTDENFACTCRLLFHFKHIGSVRHYLSENATKTLTSCILSRIDYCNRLLVGAPDSSFSLSRKFKTLQQLILKVPHHQQSTPLLRKLHWLPVSECIKHKAACMFQCYHWLCSTYLFDLLHLYSQS